jgi:hypothetical protein
MNMQDEYIYISRSLNFLKRQKVDIVRLGSDGGCWRGVGDWNFVLVIKDVRR